MRPHTTISRPRTTAPQHGFTIVEIVVTFLIIAVLTLILVPVVANRSRDAKIASAQQDLQHLSDAEERAAIDTGYYYRPYALNDTLGQDGVANALDNLAQPSTVVNQQGLFDNNATLPNNFYEQPDQIFILVSDGAATGDYAPNYASLLGQAFLNETSFGWHGPYINWQRDVNQNDWPDDPWGNDYAFFTNKGMIWPSPRINGRAPRPDTTKQFQTSITIGGTVFTGLDKYYDRPTWVSFGPNGVPGDGKNPPTYQDPVTGDFPGKIGHGDDIVRQFGGGS